MRIARTLTVAAVAAALLLPARAEAQVDLTPGEWEAFAWPSTTQLITATFRASTGILRVTDSFVPGDVFEVFADGISLGLTSPIDPDQGSAEPFSTDPDGAFASGLYSTGVFSVTPGSIISLSLAQGTDCCRGGAAYLQSAAVVTPEPGTMALLAAGMLGLGFVAIRRRELFLG